MAGAGSAWPVVGLVLIWLLALVVGVGGGLLVAVAADYLDRPLALAVVVGVVVEVAWVVLPVIASAMDATVNPRWFELLPFTPAELGRGLLAAGAAGPGGLATVLVVGVGLGGGYWPGWWGVITVPLLVALLTFVGVVSGRLATTALSDLLARSGWAALAPLMIFLPLGLASLSVTSLVAGSTGGGRYQLPGWLLWMAVTPGGAVGLAMAATAEGPWWMAMVALVWGLVAAAALTWAHGQAVARMQTRSVTVRSRRVKNSGATLGSGLARLIPAADLRVAAAKEGRYLRRDPRLRAQLVGGLVTIGVFAYLGATVVPARYSPFVAVALTWATVTSLVPNQFGVDAGSFWAYVVSPTNIATALAGKNLMWGLAAAPVAVVAAIAGCVIAGSFQYLSGALLLSAAVALVWLAVGNMTSIFGAFPLPERQVFSTGPTGGRAILVSLGGLAVSGALTMPMLVLLALGIYFGEAWGATFAGLGSLLYGGVLFRFGFAWAKSAVVERRFQLLESLDRA